MHIKFEWDEAKRRANLAKHGVDFPAVEGFDWDSAKLFPDDRQAYGEDRFLALGLIGTRIHVLIYVLRGAAVRVISLRKANPREERKWLE